MKIPFEQQTSPSRPFSGILCSLQVGKDISGEELAREIERYPDAPLPLVVRDYLIRLLRRQVKRKKGRKRTHPAVLDFGLSDASIVYDEQLRQFQNEDIQMRAEAKAKKHKLPRGRIPPNVRAAQHVLAADKTLFPNISPRGLINLLSRHGYLHPKATPGSSICRDEWKRPDDG